MLDSRVYRAAWAPVLLAVVIAAFSLEPAGRGTEASLSPEAFDGAAAVATLRQLGEDPETQSRVPGGPGDAIVADRVQDDLGRAGFEVTRRTFSARTATGVEDLEAVVAERTGLSSRRLVVVADRSALEAPAIGEASATAALLELGRVLGGRTLQKTLVLVSTSGGPGAAGIEAAERAAEGQADAVVVLGDLSGTGVRRPFVVPWSDRPRAAPVQLRRTAESALRAEVGRPGEWGLVAQFARLAFPLTLSGQGPLVGSGVPAVALSSGGERPRGGEVDLADVDAEEMAAFGRATLRTITALDEATRAEIGEPEPYMVVARKELSQWTIRLLVGALLVPVGLAVVDGVARVRRRRGRPLTWTRWALAGTLPVLLTVGLLYLLRLTGLLDGATPGAIRSADAALDAAALVAIALVVMTLALGWLALRPLVLRLVRAPRRPDAASADGLAPAGGPARRTAGAAAGTLSVAFAATLVLWVLNPWAAALAAPALHLWLLAIGPETRPAPRLAVPLVLLGALPAVAVATSYALAFGTDPVGLGWTVLLAVAGGAVSPVEAVLWSLIAGSGASVLAIAGRRAGSRAEAAPPITVRGPSSYAGPGSLGGTRSALRR